MQANTNLYEIQYWLLPAIPTEPLRHGIYLFFAEFDTLDVVPLFTRGTTDPIHTSCP